MPSPAPPRWLVAVSAALTLALFACYSPNQRRLEKSVQDLIHPGMPMSTAVAELSSRGFTCSGQHPVTCARIRQRLLPSSCVERVNLESGEASTVGRLDVPTIACAGF
jgi:hypothetical protein